MRNSILALAIACAFCVPTSAFAQASDQGCDSSGGTAAGCTVDEGDTDGEGGVEFSGDIFTVTDASHTTYEAAKIPVNSAPASISGSCGQGVGFTNDNASFSVASSNPVCDLLNVAEAYGALGQVDKAVQVIDEAHKAARLRSFWGSVRQCLTLGLL